MFTAAVFTTEKTQQQPKLKCPPTEGWVKKTWDVYTMEYCVCTLGCVRCFATPWTIAHQAPLSMGFPGQASGAGCHFLLQGIFLTEGLNPDLLHCGQILHCWATGEACNGILLSHRENEAMPSAETNGPRDYHTKSVRERHISYDITYMWNLIKR